MKPFDRMWRCLGGIWILTVVVLSLLPDMPTPPGPQGDKLNHLIAYAGLMNWFCQIDRGRAPRIRWAIALMALGVAIEIAQSWTGWRTYDHIDMLADACGIALGWIVAPSRGFDIYGRLKARARA